ncbi:hypothetical protein DICPUDRAFT_80825 [Dictyostelium purpureum]|uniref:EGF-like domain-containing protein n=1 Tax=Dictyostelium purpureum TaxID=5786 RepID=F0ZRN1_DICPU|nr:uncharacterized protein DICPUDRAFT_80825 [Dictyostelium purpureum]EGC33399.1 hypothetical protein DICPUDRAFT_80825 [Dictyostelium purpureum]|eukprot:XP_003290063.1 hypothetical protein DICPUDRAFT_80825 [Dictyostelium purpureum]
MDYNNVFVNGQISQSDQNVFLTIDPNNRYSRYPDKTDLLKCTFGIKFIVQYITSPILEPLSGLFINNYDTFYELITTQDAGQGLTSKFRIKDRDNQTLFTDFNLELFCHSIDVDSLEIKALPPFLEPQLQNNIKTFYFYLSIKGLKYPVPLSIEPSLASNGITIISTPIEECLYILMVTNINVQYFLDLNAEFNLNFTDNRKIIVKSETIFRTTNYQNITYKVYPETLSNILFRYPQNGFLFSPVVIVKSDLTPENAYFLSKIGSQAPPTFKLASQSLDSGNNMVYNYIFPISVNSGASTDFLLSYNNGSTSIFDTGAIPQSSLSLGPLDTFSLLFNNIAGTYFLTNLKYQTSFCGFSFVSEFPYGFIEGTNSAFYYKSVFFQKLSNGITDRVTFQEYTQSFLIDLQNPNSVSTTDISPPKVTHLEFIHISGFIFLFKVGLSDETAVKQILIGKYIKKSIACEGIIDGDCKNGLFESAIDIEDLYGYLALDSYGNQKDFNKDSYLYTNSEGFSVYFTIPVPDVQYYPLKFLLTDDISTEDFQENLIKESTIRWDDRLKLFYCDFIVPKNTNHKVINYKISSPYKGVKSHAFPPLRVLKTNFDNDGPIISSITNIDGKTGWRIGITDTPNGFGNGYIKAIVIAIYIAIISPFNVTAFYPTKTNTFIVLPTYFNTTGLLKPFEPTSTPELTKTPIPTNKPQQCLGSPLCGGPSHGKCVENQGCVCVSPWIGIDCSSRIVIVDPPLANNSDPSTEIVLP